ncbi:MULTISPECIES: rod shape-determining protein MreD [Actinomadura]|uniref:Rod shape-determining protein MreD n=1 Tax=Actinomadura litoris TaxID=2678616 RepID=A0A7K1L3E1_9ACTN|nr:MULTISPECIES: rod shape-determining protein MreD [Actinomadura]MBT2213561.1 rod shape-determining protein MreD [Actinomadura sp. NEAU-AAG7]MUN38941.1 rod shape-determining protein MreD [Actinomadura litoris]
MLNVPEKSQTGRRVMTVLVVAVALILQVSVANRLPTPGGVQPDLVLLAVVALALVSGSMTGMVTGFLAGLAADIVPPADHTLGRYALVYCLIGYLCGIASAEMDRQSVVPFFAVAAGALAGAVLYAATGMILGDPRAEWGTVSRMVPLQVVYDVVASPFVVWAVLRVTRRFERGDRARGDRFSVPAARYRAMSGRSGSL